MSDNPVAVKIEGLVAGDDWTIRRTVLSIPLGQALTDAWLTVKGDVDDLDADAIVQKQITPIPNADGEIEDNGGSTGTGIVRFDLSPEDTVKFKPFTVYVWDIQVLTNADKINTPKYAYGTLEALPQVTITTDPGP